MPLHKHLFWTLECDICGAWLTAPGNPPSPTSLFGMHFFNPFSACPYAILDGWTTANSKIICPSCIDAIPDLYALYAIFPPPPAYPIPHLN